MLTKLLSLSVVSLVLVASGFGLTQSSEADQQAPAVPQNCCEKKLACCNPPSACCFAEVKLGCCEKGLKCCEEVRACCQGGKVEKCCVTGEACCDQGKECCGPKAKAASVE